jgi:hypothetical protein
LFAPVWRTTFSRDGSDGGVAGVDASWVGNIQNGGVMLPPDPVLGHLPSPWLQTHRRHAHTSTVTTDAQGNLWLVFGTDSGFEVYNEIYYTGVAVTLQPVE